MTNETFNNKILTEIHAKKIHPLPRWYFLTQDWFLKLIIVIVTAIGSTAVASTMFILTDHDWFAVSYLDEGLVANIIKTVPYVWLVIIALLVVVIYYNVRKIGRGYRYEAWKIVCGSLLVSVAVGTSMFIAGFGDTLHRYFSTSLPLYDTLVNKDTVWIYPEQGLLSGTVVNNRSVDSFTLNDEDEQSWTIISNNDTDWRTNSIAPGEEVKIIGEMQEGNIFLAHTVLPWDDKDGAK